MDPGLSRDALPASALSVLVRRDSLNLAYCQVPPHSSAKYRTGWGSFAWMPSAISKNDQVIPMDELGFGHRTQDFGDFAGGLSHDAPGF
jgi:hypothetical protein